MFDTLSDKLQATLGDLRGHGKLTEEHLSKAMREIRLALLEADVNFQVVKDFVARVRERAAGAEVMKSLTPGQEVVRIVHEELTAIMGEGGSKLAFSGPRSSSSPGSRDRARRRRPGSLRCSCERRRRRRSWSPPTSSVPRPSTSSSSWRSRFRFPFTPTRPRRTPSRS
jgi:signal recognition particle subunit SRP54